MLHKSLFTMWIAVIVVTCSITTVHAEEAPSFIKNTYPEQAIDAAVQEMEALEGDNTVLSPKVRELIGLGVAAQIPCMYCIYYHTRAAKSLGATDAEIKEALATAAQTRKWSTVLSGSLYDEGEWIKEVDAMFPSK